MTADLSIFKAYDIRGIVGKTLTEDVVRDIGRVLGTMAKEKRSSIGLSAQHETHGRYHLCRRQCQKYRDGSHACALLCDETFW